MEPKPQNKLYTLSGDRSIISGPVSERGKYNPPERLRQVVYNGRSLRAFLRENDMSPKLMRAWLIDNEVGCPFQDLYVGRAVRFSENLTATPRPKIE